jgi:NAD(P)-dependent dehydrogenase (short-subunit alcohol dehydrogenase family)
MTAVALVTGAGKGIGAACVGRFVAAGMSVALIDRDGEALDAEATRHDPAAVLPVRADVTRRAEVDAAVARTMERFGRLDVLINNAGVAFAARLEAHSDEDWHRLLDVNLTSAFYFVRAAAPALRAAHGAIVNVSSMTAMVGQPEGVAYTAAKGGLISLTKALAVELAPDGVRVNCVCPAGVDTPLMRQWAGAQPDPTAVLAAQARMHLVGRMATPEEIAETVYFLASPAASFVTGVIFPVEGGATLGYRRA